jgi:hypothetical protein
VTTYVGETMIVWQTATWAGEPLTGPDIASVYATIYDADSEVVVGPEAMTWNPNAKDSDGEAQPRWEYMWDTAGLSPGTYRARIEITGVNGTVAWEYLRMRLKADPLPPATP